MAGHFILWSISPSDINNMLGNPPAGRISPLQHIGGQVINANNPIVTYQGWNLVSRAELARIRNSFQGLTGGVRTLLPPHRYMEFDANTLVGFDRTAYWINDLYRPSPGLNFGLTALCQNAANFWNAGKKYDALIAQNQIGSVSIEYYYIGVKEMF
ncbi:MAG: hypothetical protein ACYCUY_00725 [Acidithiobacillus sp.]